MDKNGPCECFSIIYYNYVIIMDLFMNMSIIIFLYFWMFLVLQKNNKIGNWNI